MHEKILCEGYLIYGGLDYIRFYSLAEIGSGLAARAKTLLAGYAGKFQIHGCREVTESGKAGLLLNILPGKMLM